MAKQPYIQFYIGDYIKDTRILPLNVRGAWVDLILFMWENDPKGELTGDMNDFARMMNCSQDEAILVIQTLKQKKIFAWTDLEEGQIRIVSRKQKKMAEISKTRKKVGELGGNPLLVNKKTTKSNILLNQKDKLNTEYETETETEYGLNKKVSPSGEVIFDIEKYLLEHQKDFEVSLMVKPGVTSQKGKEILKKYHLWLTSKEGYPKPPLALIAGFQTWILNEKYEKNGSTYRNGSQSATAGGQDPTRIGKEGIGEL